MTTPAEILSYVPGIGALVNLVRHLAARSVFENLKPTDFVTASNPETVQKSLQRAAITNIFTNLIAAGACLLPQLAKPLSPKIRLLFAGAALISTIHAVVCQRLGKAVSAAKPQ